MEDKTKILIQYLNGELSVEDMVITEEKILSDQSWNHEFNVLQEIFSSSKNYQYPEAEKTNEGWADFTNRIKTTEKQISINPRKTWLRYAAVFALLFVTSIGVYTLIVDTKVVWTSHRERITNQLPDGSWVVLEPNSELSFDKSDFNINRRVWVNGDVYFTVVKDKKHPFEVSYKEGKLLVLGTRFRLTQDRTASIISLFSGSVKIISRTNEMIMKPGETVSVIEGTFVELNKNNSDPFPELFSLNFNDVSFANIVKGLENRFDVRIKFPEKLKEQKFTVQAEGLELDDALNVLAKLSGTVVHKYKEYLELKF